ncbi:hypothetical protein CA40472_06975 [Corynebacterium ammoniagenes]|nr:hypothetical protein [Corynebacterium ammoniagenes]AQS73678.1 hypothetical protein CA40472_06975 [Corynebacterium ammoniagenes]
MIHTSGGKSEEASCLRCGKSIINQGRGRPKKYCSPTCKQRAYEKRVALRSFSDNDKALILSPERAVNLHDGLFELRCSAEDIATAVQEEAPASEIRSLVEELVGIARRVEELR